MEFRQTLLAVLVFCLGLFGCRDTASGQDMFAKAASGFPGIEIPNLIAGQLVTVWSWGKDVPTSNRTIVITTNAGSRQIDLEGVAHARWLSTGNLLVQQRFRDASGAIENRLIQVDQSGAVIEELSAENKLSAPEPSPDGRWLAVLRYNEKGFAGLAIKDLHIKSKTVNEYDKNLIRYNLSNPVWDLDSSRLAVALWSPDKKGRLWPLLAVLTRDRNSIEYPVGDSIEDQSEPSGITPLFWSNNGIYAKSDRGLLKCALHHGGCELIYDPGKHRSILDGTLGVNGHAFLLVRDLQLDPLEARAKEIHDVDLLNGSGSLLVRAPDDLFISSIDWKAK